MNSFFHLLDGLSLQNHCFLTKNRLLPETEDGFFVIQLSMFVY
ncbi:hypothetical protein SD77_0891 [Bacillus badius]|uniref:Mobile element protein n=1 Tax=Bacillus badius TaxID=1455 RepID=A0ABR5AT27_BACBA|nr:hypothetical protein SD78_2595 [Bacillus badius]KIL77912.1 hypothetical protein SD77_0891 [Bacillus badius]